LAHQHGSGNTDKRHHPPPLQAAILALHAIQPLEVGGHVQARILFLGDEQRGLRDINCRLGLAD
jgi:hypothetical protein